MKVVFFGTPQFSAEILKDLIAKGLNIVAVVTQPDKKQGRNLKVEPPSVKKAILEISPNTLIIQPKKISTNSFYQVMEELQADLFVVVAFGQIFPVKLLEMPRLGCVNVHTSLLPKYRGAAPIQRAIMEGEKQTGVTIMYMVKELDAGDILAVRQVAIEPHMNALDLTLALCEASKKILFPTLLSLDKGDVKPQPQNHEAATYAKKVEPKDAQINWVEPAQKIYQHFRGVTPKPGSWCSLKIRDKIHRLKILDMKVSKMRARPAEIISFDKSGFIIGTGQDSIEIIRLQLEGKKRMPASEFIKGYAVCDLNFELDSMQIG